MRELPTGTVTFLFSDIEGSTRMLRELGPEAYGRLQDDHAAVMRAAIAAGDGVEIRTEGDAFFAAFPSATGALGAAVHAQRGLASHPWPDGSAIRVRIGLHTGEGALGGDDYLGIDVNKAARIAATGHGGQIVVSSTTAALAADGVPPGVATRDLGTHALKDFEAPERLYDLAIDGLDDTFPPLRTADADVDVLPTPRTSFVGREAHVAEIAATVAATRLTTLTGPGGSGKTRLAIETASRLRHRFRDGVVFVDLSAVTERDLIVPSIMRALRIRAAPGGDPVDALAEHLHERRTLLVLDTLEQLVDDARVVGELLDGAPAIRVLATSRLPLRLAGEVAYPVPPLALPDASQDPSELEAAEAIRLFLDRAATVRPGFRIDETNAAAVVGIVSALDALPLAIELAAARLRVLDPATIADRLDDRLSLLTGGPTDAPARHRTLESSIRWSEETLAPDARRLFARLAVFAGGWILDAAESVCGDDLDVLDGLTSLVDSSLVLRSDGAELRFRMLETIRAYATERYRELDPDERLGLERRHLAFVQRLATDAEPHLTGENQLAWLDRLEREHDNVRVALERAGVSGDELDVQPALETGAAIWRFWQQRGHLPEGRARLGRLLGLPAAAAPDATRVRALGALGSIEYWLADYASMRTHYEEAAELARKLGDARLLSQALLNLSFVDVEDHTVSIAQLEEAVELAGDNDPVLQARAWTSIGYGQAMTGDLDGAVDSIERAIELHRAAGERLALCETLIARAGLALLLGDRPDAEGRLREAMQLVVGAPGPMMLAQVVEPHALLANLAGRFERAAILMGAWGWIQRKYDVNFPEAGTALFGDQEIPAREALGDAGFEAAAAIGREMDIDAIIAFLIRPDGEDEGAEVPDAAG